MITLRELRKLIEFRPGVFARELETTTGSDHRRWTFMGRRGWSLAVCRPPQAGDFTDEPPAELWLREVQGS